MQNLIDLHTHSVLSTHAYSSPTENLEAAFQKGLKYYGLSEHQFDDKRVGAHYYAFNNLRVFPKEYKGMRFLKGIEFNILNDGSIDKTGLRHFDIDYGIASIHSFIYDDQGKEGNTLNYLKALEDEDVLMLGHLDDGHHETDFERIIKRTKELNKLVELNHASLMPWSKRINTRNNLKELIRLCKKYDQPVIINSDAHIMFDVGNFEYVLDLLKEEDFPLDKVLNFNEDLIKKFLKVE